MTRKREHRSYHGRATWDDFPCASALYTNTAQTQHTPNTNRREKERKKKRKKRKKEKKKKREKACKALIKLRGSCIEA